MGKIVSIGAHALDAELMGGPMMIKEHLLNGTEFTFVHLTRGERGNKTKSAEVYGEQLDAEIPKVAQAMGGTAHWLGYKAGQLPDNDQMIEDIKKYLKDNEVTTVITHWRGSLHDRHILCHDLVKSAVNALNQSGSKITLLYGENCEDLNGFNSELYVQFDQNIMDVWMTGLNHYELFNKSESVPYNDFYRAISKIHAIELGLPPFAKTYMQAPHVIEGFTK